MLKRGLPPSHPGEILKDMFINERGLTITEVAKGLNMARANLSSVINGHLGVSPELAVKLSEALAIPRNSGLTSKIIMSYGTRKEKSTVLPYVILKRLRFDNPNLLKKRFSTSFRIR